MQAKKGLFHQLYPLIHKVVVFVHEMKLSSEEKEKKKGKKGKKSHFYLIFNKTSSLSI